MLFVPEELRKSPAAELLRRNYSGLKGYLTRLRKNPQRLRLTLMIGGTAAVFLISAFFWITGGRYVSTDNA